MVSTIKSGGNEFKSLTNVTYEPDSFVGNNLDDETAKRGFTGQPNILFWEAHTDVGGPIKRDKVWFYGAYNHFKIDKEISGVPRQYSDLGVFDNYTGKVSATPVAEGHARGLLPVGPEVQAPPRTVGVDRPRFASSRRTAARGCTTASGSASGPIASSAT